jgi:peptidoglycan/LPS O-acetylase OafA/YrhL
MLALLVDRYKTSSFIDKARQISILFASTLLPLFISRQLHIASQGGGITNSTGIFDLKEIIVIELFFILVVAAVTFSRHTIFLNTKIKMVCVVLGGITYPLYLLHSKISEVIIKHQGLTYGEINTFSVTWTVFVIVISYYISMYEVPIRKLIKRKLFRV